METNPNSLDGIFETLEYYELWHKWFIKSPPNKELIKFNKMNKKEQYDYLKGENKWKSVEWTNIIKVN